MLLFSLPMHTQGTMPESQVGLQCAVHQVLFSQAQLHSRQQTHKFVKVDACTTLLSKPQLENWQLYLPGSE